MEQGTMKQVAMKDVILAKHNTRAIVADDPDVKDLAQSIEAHGLLQPVICRPVLTNQLENKFELLAGARRFAAHQVLKRETISAIVREMDDQAALEVTVLENLQRKNLRPLEEARGVALLLEGGATATAIAAKIGKSIQWVLRRAKLVELHPEMLKAIDEGDHYLSRTSVSHLELLATFPVETQALIFEEFNNSSWIWAPERINDFREKVAALTRRVKLAPWDKDDVTLDPKAGACSACKKRSSCQPGLFDDELDAEKIAKDDTCLDGVCYDAKGKEYVKRVEAELAAKNPGLIRIVGENSNYEDRQEAVKGGAVDFYYFQKAKKGDKEAVPALVVTGTGIGKVQWVRVNAGAARRATDKTDTTDGDNTGPTLEEKRAQLAWRRKAWVIKQVEEHLDKSRLQGSKIIALLTKKPTMLLAMAAAFGTDERHNQAETTHWKNAQIFSENTPRAVIALWPMVSDVLMKRMAIFGSAQQCQAQYEEALNVMELLDMGQPKDWLELAATEIPEPRSWGGMAEKNTENSKQKTEPEKKPAKAKAGKKAKKPAKK